jgi:hypothetical protein
MSKKPEAATAEEKPDFVTLATDTLMGDLRDFVLDRLKHEHNPLPWNMRGEDQQRETINRVESAMRTWVHRAVVLIAAQGAKAARGSLIKFVVKDGIQMQINFAASDALRHELADHVGNSMLVIIADTEIHQGERSAVPVTPDQGRITIDDPPEEEAAD